MTIQDLEPGMCIAGRNLRSGGFNVREIVSISGRRITYKVRRYDRGMDCNRIYTCNIGDFIGWANRDVTERVAA
ncbi:hypothetical protein [Mesoterricola silvestris]|uniref:Uncharacterized protein n=1 Tax=Mesoterricola silvestris TaxID=2927979 RepID=A0AA48K7X5_9BACT|nr:hypothetical protein [Mesoterricola silvestris]BDU72364.1 hypothetical protein METEAL_15380 [Mesoterricola silvestris]